MLKTTEMLMTNTTWHVFQNFRLVVKLSIAETTAITARARML